MNIGYGYDGYNVTYKALLSFPEEQLGRRRRDTGVHGSCGGHGQLRGFGKRVCMESWGERYLWSAFWEKAARRISLHFSLIPLEINVINVAPFPISCLFVFSFALLVLMVKAKPAAHSSVMLMVQAPCSLTAHSKRLFKENLYF